MLPIRGIHVLAALLNLQDRHLWQKLRHARPSHRTYCGMPLEHSRYNWGRLKLHVNVYVAYCGHFQLHRTFFLLLDLAEKLLSSPDASFDRLRGCRFKVGTGVHEMQN